MLGIGTDIIAIDRVEAVYTRLGERFVARILAPQERSSGMTGRQLAKAFCAKEAVVKALGTGFRMGIGWHDIVIGRNTLGAPTVVLHGAAATRLQALGGQQVLLSIADEKAYAVAYAVIS